MENSFIYQIAKDLKSYHKKVLRLENSDGFFKREDINAALKKFGIYLYTGTYLELRIQYELRNVDEYCILISDDKDAFLPDIMANSSALNWSLENYFNFLHLPSIKDLDIKLLNQLFKQEIIIPLNKTETNNLIQKVKVEKKLEDKLEQETQLVEIIKESINYFPINWNTVASDLGELIKISIKNDTLNTYNDLITDVNNSFQIELETNYRHIKNSSPVKKPRIVSKILDHLSFNFLNNKVALLVVDGLAYWQFHLIKQRLNFSTIEDTIYSWIPSITQLSRQAIFRGSNPIVDYKQAPLNEKTLWKNYWISKGIPSHQITYLHSESLSNENLTYSKIALVYKELDDKMHSSDDYKDLYHLTINWLEKTSFFNDLEVLVNNNYKVFLTTDHGNVEAKSWRSLVGKEKLGTNKSGSRSERHIEYTDSWLKEELFNNNPDLADFVLSEENALYFKNNLSFSNKDTLVTHGGAHVLEVLIPFIEIKNNEK
ncbi:PglZ domain-containing protein [Myroides odoratus]|uniref:PglZ domain-containing protein n=1 Tax=Myroides odoratus TaxID=256 RepID=UPI003341386F